MRRSLSFASGNDAGSGPAVVPRVSAEMNPARRRMLRMPRFCVLCGTARRACRARKAFWTIEQRLCGSIAARGVVSAVAGRQAGEGALTGVWGRAVCGGGVGQLFAGGRSVLCVVWLQALILTGTVDVDAPKLV